MEKNSTDVCCLTLPLKLEKWQEDRLAKRFEIARQIYNTMVRAELKKLRQVERSAEYRAIQEKIRALSWNRAADKPKLIALYKEQGKFLRDKGFSENAFRAASKNYYKHFSENIGKNVTVDGIAPLVWSAFEKALFKQGGKRVRFKRVGGIHSLRGRSISGVSGGGEITFRDTYIEWKGLKLPLKLSPGNAYEAEMLSYRVKFVRILRKPGKKKDRWYAQLCLEGKPAVKRDPITGAPKHSIGQGTVGIDIGSQTLAYAASTEVNLVELADQAQNIEREKRRLQSKMDRSRRATNPDNYAENGTIRRGVKLTRNKSKRYLKLQRELRYLTFCKAETCRRQHIALANQLLSFGDRFYVGNIPRPYPARRTKQAKWAGKAEENEQKHPPAVNRLPSLLVEILDLKCRSRGLPGVVRVPAYLKASRYNHQSGTYTAQSPSEHWNEMQNRKRIQRDLYTAFVLQHYNPQLGYFDQKKIQQDYPQFVRLHDQTMQRLSALPKTPSSMGVRQRIS